LHTDQDDNLLISWLEPTSNHEKYRLLYSELHNKSWSDPSVIAEGENWFVNWADYPSVISSNGSPFAAHWLKKIPGGPYSYNVNISISSSTSNSQKPVQWSEAITPHRDSTATEHGFVSMVNWNNKNKEVLAIWLDGRKTADRADNEYYDINRAMTLRSAVIDKNGTVSNKKVIDQAVCDCCNTSLALTKNGAIAVYRNRTDREIRDIYISKFENNRWSTPLPVHSDGWQISACPVNGPEVAIRDSTVLITWFTAADNTSSVKAAVSTDLGNSFPTVFTIDEGNSLGRVDAAISPNGDYFVSWMDRSADQALLKVTKIETLQGVDPGATYEVAEMDASRNSGFPQMETVGNSLVLAWTAFDKEGNSRIETIQLPISVIF